jgi:hypothetical protein
VQRDWNTFFFNENKEHLNYTKQQDTIYNECIHRQLTIDNNPQRNQGIWLPKYGSQSETTINQIKFIYIALRTSADISKCCTETQPKTPNSKQCRCRSTVARKNSIERPKPRKKPREEPGYVGGQSSSGCAGWRS